MFNKTLLKHIESLSFIYVPVVIQTFPNGSNIGYCHQNCLNYVLKFPEARVVRGWIEKNYITEVKREFVLHSLLEVDGKLIDPTPWDIPAMRGLFAEDKSITWVESNSKEWEFHNHLVGRIPPVVSGELDDNQN